MLEWRPLAMTGLPASVPDLVFGRMLNEFACCPRLAYLEWVHQDFGASAPTAERRYQHRRVDGAGGELPEVADAVDAPSFRPRQGPVPRAAWTVATRLRPRHY
jgi:hypothetical protein